MKQRELTTQNHKQNEHYKIINWNEMNDKKIKDHTQKAQSRMGIIITTNAHNKYIK